MMVPILLTSIPTSQNSSPKWHWEKLCWAFLRMTGVLAMGTGFWVGCCCPIMLLVYIANQYFPLIFFLNSRENEIDMMCTNYNKHMQCACKNYVSSQERPGIGLERDKNNSSQVAVRAPAASARCLNFVELSLMLWTAFITTGLLLSASP